MKKSDKDQKKILVPVDGSDRSFNTVRFIARFTPFTKMTVVLYNVFHSVPESYWDLRNEPMMKNGVAHLAAWESQNRQNMKEFMKRCRTQMIMSGHKDENIKMKINKRKKGIARDIIKEAKTGGYTAVITRRRGFTTIPGLLMGSVAEKLMNALTFVPVFFAGIEMPGPKILVALDSSENSLKAVKFLASIANGDDYKVTLLHTTRLNEDIFNYSFRDNYRQSDHTMMEKVFQESRSILEQKGFQPESIDSQILDNTESRAAAIAKFAADGEYNTIFMGRQGLSRVNDFLLGRVSRKVIHAANTRTVCIV